MSQGSLNLPTTGTLSGLQLVQDINAALANLESMASGSTDPSTLTGGVAPFSLWLDTSVTPNTLRMRNSANSGWADIGNISGSTFSFTIGSGTITAAMLAAGAALSNLGYTPVNGAGDTMTGQLKAPSFALGNWAIETLGNSIVFKNNGTIAFTLNNDGSMTATGNITAYYGS